MALQMNRDSKWFYGRVMVNGARKSVNLGVEIKGKRPRTLREEGDPLFERSRGQAQEKLRKLQTEAKERKASVEILQTIHEARTGERANSISLRPTANERGMFEAWKAVPRKRKQSKRYVEQIESLFERFIVFLGEKYSEKKIREMADVRSHMARAFMLSEESRGVSAKTYNNELTALRSPFSLLAKEAAIFENPFDGIPTKEEDTAFRKPFDIDELSAIIEVANREEHDFIRPIIITGIGTAMRRGDCCLLSPQSVDLENRFIRVKTGKTKKIAEIPLFPLLEDEFTKHSVTPTDRYFFPKQAEMYLNNPDGITWRVKKVLKDAGYFDSETKTRKKPKAAHVADVHIKRETGLRVASIRDFHSFRVSWVTLALTSGVDLELVRMVTGHKTVDIVLKHYFQPGRDYFRKSLQSKMPGLLMNHAGSDASDVNEGREAIFSLMELTMQLDADNCDQLRKQIMDGLKSLLENSIANENDQVSRLLLQA